MDEKYELRRGLLRALINDEFGGVIARFADATDIKPDYVSRLLYPDNKPGRKRLGEGTIEKIEKALDRPGYFAGGDGPELYAHAQKMKAEGRGWLRGPGQASESSREKNEPDPQTIAGLLDRLAGRLRTADPMVRDEVARLVSRYLEHPEQGARIAKAIEALLGENSGDAATT